MLPLGVNWTTCALSRGTAGRPRPSRPLLQSPGRPLSPPSPHSLPFQEKQQQKRSYEETLQWRHLQKQPAGLPTPGSDPAAYHLGPWMPEG